MRKTRRAETEDVYSIPTARGTITSIIVFQWEVEEDEGMEETGQRTAKREKEEGGGRLNEGGDRDVQDKEGVNKKREK